MIENHPKHWKDKLPRPDAEAHKYSRGQAVILAAPDMFGATVLAATACARMGAGIVRVVVADDTAKAFYQTLMPSHIIVMTDFDVVYHKHTRAVLAGPGLNQGDELLDKLLVNKPENAMVILDGGALSYVAQQGQLHDLDGTIITPHAGEYERLFSDTVPNDAAATYQCLIVKKGHETMITNGHDMIINRHASPWLASAGTGDVLAGMITGLTAQGMDPMDACAAAVWIHGEAGIQIGAGLVASDIPDCLGKIYAQLIQ